MFEKTLKSNRKALWATFKKINESFLLLLKILHVKFYNRSAAYVVLKAFLIFSDCDEGTINPEFYDI